MVQPLRSNALIELPADELELARLIGDKLAMRLQGTLSVGLSMLVSKPDSVSPAFFDKQFEILKAFALVLGTVSGHPSRAALLLELERQSADLLEELHKLRMTIASTWPALLDHRSEAFRSIQEIVESVFDLLAAYTQSLGIECPTILRAQSVLASIFDSLTELPESVS
jgi:hypothetical protein